MSFSGSSEFVERAQAVFAPLLTDYGFEAPVVDDLGREVFVRYHRGSHTVAVSMECGAPPIVELFYPCAETGEGAVVWAERNGVDRARRGLRMTSIDLDQPLGVQLEHAFETLLHKEGGFLRS